MALRIIIISDTHGMHDMVKLPMDGDMIIHCGDWTNQGREEEIVKFMDWFSNLDYSHKVCIPGNHELGLDKPGKNKKLKLIKEYEDKGINFLLNKSVDINGLKIYGSPSTPLFYDWAFQYNRGKDIAIEWEKIPLDTNILITHGPPYGMFDLVQDIPSNRGRDMHQGCKDLMNRIKKLKKLKLHCFGHFHFNHGMTEKDGVIFVNASTCDELYRPIKQPIIINI